MQKKSVYLIIIVAALMAAFVIAPNALQAQATANVTIKFAVSGLSNVSVNILTVDGTDYNYWNMPTFHWKPDSVHTVSAKTPLEAWDHNVFRFSSWTNGDGLTGSQGTFTTPNSDTTVTANYVSASVKVKFASTDVSKYSSDVLTIDGMGYNYWNLPTLTWISGTTHTIKATTPLTCYDKSIYRFSSWTNGNGLVGADGIFTVPDSDVTVTANYVLTTVEINFATTVLPTFTGGVVLTIDGTGYDYWNLPSTHFIWETGTTHTIKVSTPLTGWDETVYTFTGWTNGNDLSGAQSTYTVPAVGTTVTANFASTAGPATTDITVNCSPSTVDKTGTETTMISGALTSSGSGVAGKTIVLSYFDCSGWVPINSVTTGADGSYSYNWDVPATLANGVYAVKAEFAGDCSYTGCAATTGTCGNGPNLFVLPEYVWGSLAALVTCFAALTLFKKRSSLSKNANA